MITQRRLIPDFTNLQAFECAARHQNFSRAAEELSLTQSAISRQIADLERQTGLKLFERIRRRVVLSDAGKRLLPEVKELLLQSERLMIGAVSAGRMRSSLKIATLPTFGAKWLVPRLGDFLQQHPDVAITVESRSSPFNFEEEGLDVAIHFGQPSWAGGICTFLHDETVVPVASRALAETCHAIAPEDLGAVPRLHLITRPKLWADWFEKNDAVVDNAYQGPRFDQFSMILAAAISGLGIALLPTYLVEEELRTGKLVAVLPLPMATENAYYVVRPEAKQTHRIADLLQSWLVHRANAEPWPVAHPRSQAARSGLGG